MHSLCIYAPHTWVDAGAYLQLCVGLVGDLESVANTDQIQGHAGYLPSVIDAILIGDPRNHHVWVVGHRFTERDNKTIEYQDKKSWKEMLLKKKSHFIIQI